MVFDTDSYPILVDSGASHCMTSCKDDFIDTPIATKCCIHGLGDTLALMMGTIQYSFQNNKGQVSYFLIKDCLYVPTLPIRILSPQHWAQNHPGHHAESHTTATHVILAWDDSVHHIPLTSANVGELQSALGYSTSCHVLCGLSYMIPDAPCCFPAHIIPPNYNDDESAQPTQPVPDPMPPPSHILHLTNGLPQDFTQGSPDVELPSSITHDDNVHSDNDTTDQDHRIFDLTD